MHVLGLASDSTQKSVDYSATMSVAKTLPQIRKNMIHLIAYIEIKHLSIIYISSLE